MFSFKVALEHCRSMDSCVPGENGRYREMGMLLAGLRVFFVLAEVS
jgi:hypothetical protein